MSIITKLVALMNEERGWQKHGDIIKGIMQMYAYEPFDDFTRYQIEMDIEFTYGDTIRVSWDLADRPDIQSALICAGSPLEGQTIYFLIKEPK